jgi:hypothetical protein
MVCTGFEGFRGVQEEAVKAALEGVQQQQQQQQQQQHCR